MTWNLLFVVCTFVQLNKALDNGLALTPPMGWLSWQRYRCETDCVNYPNSCINQQLYMDMADRLVEDGWKDLGYVHVNIDDCWPSKTRDSTTNEQVPDPERFPDGIDGLADYMHSRGLRLGLYSDIGASTCGGYPGMEGYLQLDANTFASWNIDMLKVDGCAENTTNMYKDYPQLGQYLNATGRPIVYSCSWPAYINGHGEKQPPVDHTTMADIAQNCNLWRNYNDIQDSWDSVLGIQSWWERDYNNYSNDQLLSTSGPGAWNDPDMIIGGDFGLSLDEVRTQMSLWAIFAAPLLMSNDLRSISSDMKAILQNKDVIAINQDKIGKQGGYIYRNNGDNSRFFVWMRELEDSNTIAILLQNTQTGGDGSYITFDTSLVPSFVNNGVWGKSNVQFDVKDLWTGSDYGTFTQQFSYYIHPSSVGFFLMTLQ